MYYLVSFNCYVDIPSIHDPFEVFYFRAAFASPPAPSLSLSPQFTNRCASTILRLPLHQRHCHYSTPSLRYYYYYPRRPPPIAACTTILGLSRLQHQRRRHHSSLPILAITVIVTSVHQRQHASILGLEGLSPSSTAVDYQYSSVKREKQ